MALLAYMAAVLLDPAGVTPATEPPHLYLRPPSTECQQPAQDGEVVVCGAEDADEANRLRPIDPDRYREAPVRAEMKLGNGKMSLHTEDKGIGGQHSKRAMVTFSLPF